jgi:putative membrane protein
MAATAQAAATSKVFIEGVINMVEWLKPGAFIGSIVFALIGVAIFWLCFIIIDKITPYNLWEEIVEKQNIALGVVVAAMCLGISLIVAAAIHG